MAVAVISRYEDLSPKAYDEIIAALDLDANPPAGAVLHVAAEAERGFVPALRTHGVEGTPQIEVAPLHNVYASEMETVERMGAFSLPATYAGATLY